MPQDKDRSQQPRIGQDPVDLDPGASLAALSRVVSPEQLLHQSLAFQRELQKIALGESAVEPDAKDWRFKDRAWSENPLSKRFAQVYLAWGDALSKVVDEDDPNWRDVQRAKFAIEMLVAAAAPTNSLWGNPAALKEMFDSGGASLERGFRSWVDDLLHRGGMPTQVDKSAFQVGENLAVTPGAVVYRSDVLELLQYRPTTPAVRARPTLMIPPQINKYYFMDLAPGRSFTEYAVSRGIAFFTISWRNPRAEHAEWNLDTYIEAILEAIDVVCEVSGSDEINTLGLCAGGITTAAMLAHQAATGDRRVRSAAFGVTLLDWEEPAMIGMFAHPTVGPLAKTNSERRGILPGSNLAQVFAWLRPNELVWNYWVNNYLMGKKPPAFDILAWNSDSTNLPAGLHADFVDIFNDNTLSQGGVSVFGKPVDLRQIEVDHFVTGGINDHLTPWRGCYRTTQLLGGEGQFVLSNAGHIASLVNPPGNPKANYYTGPEPGPDPDTWLQDARRHTGTWWEVWADWVIARAGEEVTAPADLGSANHSVLEPAPGRYVLDPA